MAPSTAAATRVEAARSAVPASREPTPCEAVSATPLKKPPARVLLEKVAVPENNHTERFAQEQIHGLIQRVFFPGWPKASKQVVISAIDAQADTSNVCVHIARGMAAGLPGTVCAVEADVHQRSVGQKLAVADTRSVEREAYGCIQVARNLWLAQPESLFGGERDSCDVVWLRTRLSELRRNFDYTLIHAPAAFLTETLVLGQLADGVILVVEAHKTHRVVARATMARLKAAKVAVLGTVLTGRTFPIPEQLYRQL